MTMTMTTNICSVEIATGAAVALSITHHPVPNKGDPLLLLPMAVHSGAIHIMYTIQLIFVQVDTIQFTFIQVGAIQFTFIQVGAIQLTFVQVDAIQLTFVQVDTIQLIFVQVDTIQLTFIQVGVDPLLLLAIASGTQLQLLPM